MWNSVIFLEMEAVYIPTTTTCLTKMLLFRRAEKLQILI